MSLLTIHPTATCHPLSAAVGRLLVNPFCGLWHLRLREVEQPAQGRTATRVAPKCSDSQDAVPLIALCCILLGLLSCQEENTPYISSNEFLGLTGYSSATPGLRKYRLMSDAELSPRGCQSSPSSAIHGAGCWPPSPSLHAFTSSSLRSASLPSRGGGKV